MMLKRLFSWFFILGVVFYLCKPVLAKTTEEELAELKARLNQLEERLGKQENKTVEVEKIAHGAKREISEFIEYKPGEGVEIKPAGLTIGAGATFIVQGAIDANATGKKGEDVTDASYSVDLEFEKEFGDSALAFIHLETGDGAGVEDELTLFSNVNRDADDAGNVVSLTEAWYEQYLFDKQLTVTGGKIDSTCYLDQNEIANDETAQFLGRIFRNAPTIEFPDNNAGIRGFFTPAEIEWFEIEAQVLDGDGDWEDIGDHVFASAQIDIKPNFGNELTGNYRIYGWCNDTNHIKWPDSTKQWKRNYGFGTSIDQQITNIFTVFGRYGWQEPKVYMEGADFSLEHTWSAGCQINGKPWNRDDDYIGLAIGMAMSSDDYKKATGRKCKDEGHFEAYYSFKVNDNLTLSPDMQVIWDPYGKDVAGRDGTITVIGCRGQVDF